VSSESPGHLCATQVLAGKPRPSNPQEAVHVSKVKVWALKLPPGPSPLVQLDFVKIDNWILLSQIPIDADVAAGWVASPGSILYSCVDWSNVSKVSCSRKQQHQGDDSGNQTCTQRHTCTHTHRLAHINLYTLWHFHFPLECSSLVDVLCSLTTKLESILDPLNNDDDFLACLFYCLFHLTEENTQSQASPSSHSSGSFSGYVPASWLQMRSAANRVFCKMLELKRKVTYYVE